MLTNKTDLTLAALLLGVPLLWLALPAAEPPAPTCAELRERVFNLTHPSALLSREARASVADVSRQLLTADVQLYQAMGCDR